MRMRARVTAAPGSATLLRARKVRTKAMARRRAESKARRRAQAQALPPAESHA